MSGVSQPARPIQRVLVGCRGDVAARIVGAVERAGLEAVAAYTDRDANGAHLDLAAYAVRIMSPGPGDPWRDQARLVGAALDSGADAVHPGIVGLARDAEFARSVLSVGLAWVGPDADHLELFEDIPDTRARARDGGLEVIPTSAVIESAEEAVPWLDRFGVPLVMRSPRRGSWRPRRLATRAEARRNFASAPGPFLLERGLPGARNVIVLVIGDGEGNAIHLGEHERVRYMRNRIVFRDCPSTGLSPEQRDKLGTAAAEFVSGFCYRGVGGVEFLVGADGHAWFVDFDPGLPEGYGLHDAVYGVDLVSAQIQLAAGEDLGWDQAEIEPKGHTVELLLLAEGAGRVQSLEFPEGILVSTALTEGSVVAPKDDPVLARIRVSAPTRHAALVRARGALTRTVLHGVPTNLASLVAMLGERAIWEGQPEEDSPT
jgi:acetyl/propionyl-CoA carboxylase alpha subunit